MNIIRKVLTIVLMVFICQNLANGQAYDSLMYKAYIFNSHSLWESAIDQFDKEPSLQKAIAYYGILNNTMSSLNEDRFDEYVDVAIEFLEKMEAENVDKAEALALRSSVYGFVMAYSPWQGIYYGPKSSAALDDALSIDSSSPIVNMVSGTSLFYTPSAFGGDKTKALKAFQKAVNLYEEQEYKGWLYLNTLALLGQTYASLDKNQEAVATYEKALAIEPDFAWVTDNLLPKVR